MATTFTPTRADEVGRGDVVCYDDNTTVLNVRECPEHAGALVIDYTAEDAEGTYATDMCVARDFMFTVRTRS